MQIKVKTTEQYRILEFIKANLKIEYNKIVLIDNITVKLIYFKYHELIFKYDNGKVIYKY